MDEAPHCAKCGSDRIIPNVRILDESHGFGNLRVEICEKPYALLFKGHHNGQLVARLCGSCGYADIYVTNPDELWDAYQKSLSET
jgi:predicted nucleic-acid-binding Zn-ribbon protein